MNKDLLNENHWKDLQNITIDVGYVEDQNLSLEILVYVEFVLEDMLENEWLCDLKKLVGNFFWFNLLLKNK